MPIFGLFGGPPNVKKLKAKRNVRGLIKALNYEKDESIREDATKALEEIAKSLIGIIKTQGTYRHNLHQNRGGGGYKSYTDPDTKGAARKDLAEAVTSGKSLITILEYSPFCITTDDLREIEHLNNVTKVISYTTDCAFGTPDDEVTILFDSSLLHQLARQELIRRKEERKQEQIYDELKNVDTLKNRGDVQGLLKILDQKKDVQVYQAATNALKQIRVPHAVELLVTALENKNSNVRLAAADVLGQIGDAQVVTPLLALLLDQDSRVLQAATQSLEQINPNWRKLEGTRETISAFVVALNEKDRNVRLAAVTALGQIGDPQTVEPLIGLLNDKDWQIRQATVEALAKIGDIQAVESLITTCLNDTSKKVRSTALASLVQIGAPVIETLGPALKDTDQVVRWNTVKLLGEIGPQLEDVSLRTRTVELLTSAREDVDEYVSQEAAYALKDFD